MLYDYSKLRKPKSESREPGQEIYASDTTSELTDTFSESSHFSEHTVDGNQSVSSDHGHTFLYKLVPYSREKSPMGDAPYIGLKLGGGRTFA